jgi:methyl-accepting chemotaxis protein
LGENFKNLDSLFKEKSEIEKQLTGTAEGGNTGGTPAATDTTAGERSETAAETTEMTETPTESTPDIKQHTGRLIENSKNIARSQAAVYTAFGDVFRYIEAKNAAAETASDFESVRDMFIIIIIAAAVIILTALILSLRLSKTITAAILQMTERAYDLAVDNVDMTRRLQVNGKDEIGELAGWFNKFLERLQHMITKVKTSSNEVFNSTEEITSSSEDLAARTNEQAASLTQTSTTLENFTSSVRQNTENSAEADMMLTSFNEDIQERKVLIENVTNTMTEIFESSKQIDNIIKVINDISFQTNLLALNAAVEAARAGEAGRGFAVVASEVRNLAQKTAESSKSIQDIVLRNVETTQKGMNLVKDTSDFFAEIVEMMGETVTKISNITNASREQSTGIEQINNAIAHMDEVSTQNAALVQELSGTGRHVKQNAVELQELVAQFKIDETSDIKGSDYYTEMKKKAQAKLEKKEKQGVKKETATEKQTAEKPASPAVTIAAAESAASTPTEDDFFGSEEEFEEF